MYAHKDSVLSIFQILPFTNCLHIGATCIWQKKIDLFSGILVFTCLMTDKLLVKFISFDFLFEICFYVGLYMMCYIDSELSQFYVCTGIYHVCIPCLHVDNFDRNVYSFVLPSYEHRCWKRVNAEARFFALHICK